MTFGEPEKIHNILSTCQRLESLRLFQCNAGFGSVLKLDHERLIELYITFDVFTTLELSFLPKLERLTYDYWPCN